MIDDRELQHAWDPPVVRVDVTETSPDQTFGPLTFAFDDPSDWMLTRVLRARAGTHGDKTFVREAEHARRSWTYAEVDRIARCVGANLQRLGVSPGERVGVMMRNSPEYVFTWFGATFAGAIEVPINPDYKGRFLEHVIELTAPSSMVIDVAAAANLAEADSLPFAGDVRFFVIGSSDDVDSVRSLLSRYDHVVRGFHELMRPGELMPVDQRPWDIGAIISTSGTTGPSKGVMMSHSQLCFFAEESRNLARLTDRDTLMLDLPLFHANAQVLTTFACLLAAADLVIFERFSPTQFSARVREYGITYTNLLGVMMDWIMAQPEQPGDRDSTLRAVLSAPTPPELSTQFRARFGAVANVEAFGQTEISLPILSRYGEDRPPGAAGLLVSDYFEVKLVDPESEAEVPVGEIGELLVRPKLPWIVNSGYWAMPEATAKTRQNLWFHTGDALRRDADGYYYFIDRIKDALRRRGHNISSFEVESALLEFPNVKECAVIAVPSEFKGGEDEVLAVVVLDPPIELVKLAQWASGELPTFVLPRYWRSLEDLPKTPSQKIRKELLRAEGITADTFNFQVARRSGGDVELVTESR